MQAVKNNTDFVQKTAFLNSYTPDISQYVWGWRVLLLRGKHLNMSEAVWQYCKKMSTIMLNRT